MFDGIKNRLLAWSIKQMYADRNIFQTILDRDPKWTEWTAENAVREGYKASVWAYTAINKKAKAAASVPWHVYRRNSRGEWEKVENSPLQTLLDKPNPFMTQTKMIERMILQLDLAGNSILQKVMLGGVPVELWGIGPDNLKPIPDKEEFIKNYEYSLKNGNKVQIPAGEIIHTMYLDPSDPFWGIAPLQVAARTVDTDIEAVNWNKVALQNRAVTDGAFTTQQPLTQQQYNDLRQQIREQHQGAANARAPWILGGGAQWQQMSLSPADMDFIEGRKLTREEIAAIFQVPPPIIGILDKANYANMQEARRVFWLDTIIPLLNDIRDTFNQTLTPHFGQDLFIDYDLANVEALQENLNEKIDAANKLFSMGVPFNVVSQRLDLGIDEIDGGDTGYLPASLMPANLAQVMAAARAGGNQDPEDKSLKKFPGRRELKGFNLRTPEQKKQYWKSFERQRAAWYAKMQAGALDLFDTEGRNVAAAFNISGDIEKALEAIDREKWEEFYIKYFIAIANEFGGETYDGFKSIAPAERKEDFDPWDQLILDRIFAAAAEKVTYVTDYTKELTRGIIYTGREQGDSIATIARDLRKNFDQFATVRAHRIARTEVVSASNFGSYQAAQQAADEVGDLEKEWIDSGDERVRDRHRDMTGERVGLYKTFSNGLEHPGDMFNGAAEDVINCRCTLIYHPVAYS